MKEPSLSAVRAASRAAVERIRTYHIKEFPGAAGTVFLISNAYPGAWMEHTYDALAWVNLDPSDPGIALRQTKLFLDRQSEAGQFPFRFVDISNPNWGGQPQPRNMNHMQECVSFMRLCLEAYHLNPGDSSYLASTYEAGCRRDQWMVEHRMQTGRGLVEMYCGYDTGHDNSERLRGMKYEGWVCEDGGYMPTDCPVAPMLATDMNANFYGNRIALAEMADLLGKPEEAAAWRKKAEEIREKIFELLFDEKDCFFYDVDKHGKRRRIKSIAITNVILEDVCSPALVDEIYERHLANPEEFATPYPFPSLAMNDPRTRPHKHNNDWGYFSMGLTALRSLRWMPRYGREKEMHEMMRAWVKAWTNCFDTMPFGQELDPYSGKPSDCSSWYSATMLYYLHAVRELGLFDEL